MSKLINWSRARRQSAALNNGSLDQMDEKERMERDAASRWLSKHQPAPSKKFSKSKRQK